MNVAEMTLKKTCEMCPEQYDVLDRQGNTIAYMRLRHGYFEVTCPDVGGTVVYAARTKGDGSFLDDERPLHIGAAVLAIERYYAPGRWISVDERMPERGQVIVYCPDPDRPVRAAWTNGRVWRDEFGHPIGLPVTHWMPLPEPPKED